jgi:hypothetical protein
MDFIRRNLSDCTKPVKASAYTTMKRPPLEYASTVWDPHSSAEIHKLEQVQRRVARLIHNNYTARTPGCVTHMAQNLGWQPLQQRRYNNRLIVMFKIIHERLFIVVYAEALTGLVQSLRFLRMKSIVLLALETVVNVLGPLYVLANGDS